MAILPPATNIERKVGLMHAANVAMIEDTSHNAFLDTCFPEAVDKLTNVCKDGPGANRDTVHKQTAQDALRLFGVKLR